MQDMLVEVGASSLLVGVESLQVHARLGARCSPLSRRPAAALPEAGPGPRGAADEGLSPAARPHPRSALDSSRGDPGAVPGNRGGSAPEQRSRLRASGTRVLRIRLVTPRSWAGRKSGT